VDDKTSQGFAKLVAQGYEGMKPGWCRVNLPYFWDDSTADYVIAAVALVAREGWRFLPEYAFDIHTGLWTHRKEVRATPAFQIQGAYALGLAEAVPAVPAAPTSAPSYATTLKHVQAMVDTLGREAKGHDDSDSGAESSDEAFPEACDALRWFAVAGHAN
jgi:hypothetical protein